jgi:serine protease AprX
MRLLTAFVLLTVMSATVALAAPDGITPRLERQLTASTNGNETFAVWVTFVDKGRSGADLAAALDEAESLLNERSRRRRAKVAAAKGGRLVDVTDLPVHQPYVDGALAVGVSLRQKSRWLNAVSLDASTAQVRTLAKLSFVERIDLVNRFTRDPEPVHPSQAIDPSADKELTWTIDYGSSLTELEQINVPPVHEAGWNGDGVLIGMLDTGFRTTHEAMTAVNVVDVWDFVNDDGNVDNEEGDPDSARNHGTMTLSTVGGYLPGSLVGPAYGASYVLAKTEDVADEQPIEEDNWVAGIEWLDTFGIDIASSSLGYTDWYVFEDMDGNTAPCTIAADLAVGKGIVVVNSAGNDRAGSWGHIIAPADGDSVITVGAVNSTGDVTSFSSPGPTADGRIKPDISAMGAGNHVASPSDDGAYLSVSGTSFSCPLTAGVTALILSRVPELTPLQVREALRATASQSGSPDNDYGWGIVNAWDAVHYFGAVITHTPLVDVEQMVAPIPVSCTITDRVALNPATLRLWWRFEGGMWQSILQTSIGGDDYAADIPTQTVTGNVDYYLEAGDELGLTVFEPTAAPASFHSFHVGPDTIPPVIVHSPLGDQTLITWPTMIAAVVTDNTDVASVSADWTLNGVPQATMILSEGAANLWTAPFPVGVEVLQPGDDFSYSMEAVDASDAANTLSTDIFSFVIIDAVGVVLVVDDTVEPALDTGKVDAAKNPIPPKSPVLSALSSAIEASRWLVDAGYVVHQRSLGELNATDLTGIQAVMLAAGGNTSPLADMAARNLIRDWVATGGRIFVEGGEVGFDVLSSPGYPDVAAAVLHADAWRADTAGDLQVVTGQQAHPVLVTPWTIPSILTLNYGAYGDQDAVDPATGALTILETANYGGAAGVLVYDDNAAPQAGQVVYLAANLMALADTTAARHLVENSMAWLLAEEGEATASMSGGVAQPGSGVAFEPVSGAIVTVAGAGADTTGVDGQWMLDGLYAGSYSVSVSAPGLASVVRTVTVGEGQNLIHVDFVLPTIWSESVTWTGPQSVPDADPAGLVVTLPVTTSDPVAGMAVSIDLSHTWVGDLTVELTSPSGTMIRLHDRSGSSDDDIVGTWDTTLTVDGPGSLTDVLGENPQGDWTLTVIDHVSNDSGSLLSCAINFLFQDTATGVDGLPIMRTALLPNVPNPFNPRTDLHFELKAPGVPSLTVYDLRGRMVRELLDGSLHPAGHHTAVWDGRHQDGREASTGVYMVRLRAGDVVSDRKVTLTR